MTGDDSLLGALGMKNDAQTFSLLFVQAAKL